MDSLGRAIIGKQKEAAGIPADIPSVPADEGDTCRWCGKTAVAMLPLTERLPIKGQNALPLCSDCVRIKAKGIRAVRPSARRELQEPAEPRRAKWWESKEQ